MKRFFSTSIATLTLTLLTSGIASAQWATLKGQFVYGKGTDIPSALKLNPTKDVQVCGKMPLFDESLVINEDNRGIANIVMWVDKPKKVHEDYKQTENDTIVIDNKWCRFEPHAVAVRTTQTLRVGNSDPVGHNSLMNFLKNTPQNPIIPGKGNIDFKLTKPEILPTKVSCSIHPWMQGLVMVQDHPYMAITDKDGKFELKNLPTGKLTIKVWQEKCGYVSSVSIDGKSDSWRRGRYSIDLKKDEEHTYVLDPKLFAGK